MEPASSNTSVFHLVNGAGKVRSLRISPQARDALVATGDYVDLTPPDPAELKLTLGDRRDEWIVQQVIKRPALGVYLMTIVAVIYLTWQVAPMLRDPDARWVAVLFMLPMIVMIVLLGRVTGKLITLNHRLDEKERRRKVEEQATQDQLEADQLLAEHRGDVREVEIERLARVAHDEFECPGPDADPGEGDASYGVQWICGVCRTTWEWRGQWSAP